MPGHSRVWIYQGDRELTETEIGEIKRKVAVFLIDWTSHGEWMKAAIDVLYNRFIVVLVDEDHTHASGCGIDKSVQFIRQVEADYKISLFDRLLTAYRDESGTIKTVRLPEFEALAEKNKVNANTIVFNNLVSTKEDMETKWEVPMAKSWHKRMLVTV